MRVKLSQAMRLQDPQQLHWCERREEEETLQRLPARAVPVRPSSDPRRKCSGRPGRGERARRLINARKLITYVKSAGGKLERPPRLHTTNWLAFRRRPKLDPKPVELAEGSRSACRSQALPQHFNVSKLIKFGLFCMARFPGVPSENTTDAEN